MQIELPSDASYEEFSEALEDLLNGGDEMGAVALRDAFPHHYETWNERNAFVYDYGEDDEW